LDKSTTHQSAGRKTKGHNKQRTSGYLEKLKRERGSFQGRRQRKKADWKGSLKTSLLFLSLLLFKHVSRFVKNKNNTVCGYNGKEHDLLASIKLISE